MVYKEIFSSIKCSSELTSNSRRLRLQFEIKTMGKLNYRIEEFTFFENAKSVFKIDLGEWKKHGGYKLEVLPNYQNDNTIK
jgi:hypothetical protein